MPDDLFLTLIGPHGPLVEFEDYEHYRRESIRQMSLDTLLDGIRRAGTDSPRWLADVLVVGIEYTEAHPVHAQAVRRALLDAGLDPDAPDEA